MFCVYWSEEDIDLLKEGFLRGESIKKIAMRLRRSPGAVNKALTRFHIRTPRIFKERAKKLELTMEKQHRLKREREVRASIRWIGMEEVVAWLIQQGDRVQCLVEKVETPPHIQNNERVIEYRINRHPKTRLQLLMYANQKRLESGDEIFLVENVTW